MTEFAIVNVIGWITYRQELDLEPLSEALSRREEISSVKYNPSKAPWVQTYFNPNDDYVAFYRTGKCSIPGCESIEHFEEMTEKVNNVMREILDFNYTPDTEISNIVATADIGAEIPLEVLALELGMDEVEYEPEQFPALLYRDSEYVVLVFASGKILCTGLTDLDEISEAMDDIVEKSQIVL